MSRYKQQCSVDPQLDSIPVGVDAVVSRLSLAITAFTSGLNEHAQYVIVNWIMCARAVLRVQGCNFSIVFVYRYIPAILAACGPVATTASEPRRQYVCFAACGLINTCTWKCLALKEPDLVALLLPHSFSSSPSISPSSIVFLVETLLDPTPTTWDTHLQKQCGYHELVLESSPTRGFLYSLLISNVDCRLLKSSVVSQQYLHELCSLGCDDAARLLTAWTHYPLYALQLERDFGFTSPLFCFSPAATACTASAVSAAAAAAPTSASTTTAHELGSVISFGGTARVFSVIDDSSVCGV